MWTRFQTIFRLFLLNSYQNIEDSHLKPQESNMGDVYNFSQQIEGLKSEIKSLKAESKYLQKKAEVMPLILMYNHVRDENLMNKTTFFSLTVYTNNADPVKFTREQIVATKDEIKSYTDFNWIHHCYIKDITKIRFDNMYGGKKDYFEYEFDK